MVYEARKGLRNSTDAVDARKIDCKQAKLEQRWERKKLKRFEQWKQRLPVSNRALLVITCRGKSEYVRWVIILLEVWQSKPLVLRHF